MKNVIIICLAACLCLVQTLAAQESRKYEIGVSTSYGLSLGQRGVSNNYGFDLSGGYKVNDHFSAGAGIGYVNYQSRLLPSGIERVVVQTEPYHAFRPYLYGRYDFLPDRKWTPFVGARMGYAFFSRTQMSFGLVYYDDGTVHPSDYEYLRDLDHTLNVKGSVYGAIDLGASLHLGKKGSKLSFGVSLDYQGVQFDYYRHSERRTNLTTGPRIGFTF